MSSVRDQLTDLKTKYREAADAAKQRLERERDTLTATLEGRGESTTASAAVDVAVGYADIDFNNFVGLPKQ